jgi:adenine-specific DNA-methyltransferase
VFEERNFIANIFWQKKTGASDATEIATITEYVLVFAKNKETISLTKNINSYDLSRYNLADEFENERGKYYIDNVDRGGLSYSDSLNYAIECPDSTSTFPNGRKTYVNDGWIWKWGKEKIEWARKNNFIEFRKSTKKQSGWSVCYKNYLKVDNENNPIDRAAPHKNVIQGILNSDAASQMKDIFGTNKDFNYAKPTDLIKDLLLLCDIQNAGIILDFFAGSGTTGQAVSELNAQDGGNRQFILCTNNEITDTTPNGVVLDVTSKRLKRVMTGKCYDGSNNFEWIKKNKALGGNLDVYDIETVADFEAAKGKTPFDIIDETLYGQEKFKSVKEKTEWVCDNFENTQKNIENDEKWLKRKE